MTFRHVPEGASAMRALLLNSNRPMTVERLMKELI